MAYPKVHIVNSTNFSVKGKVKYASAFCSDDNYEIAPWGAGPPAAEGSAFLQKCRLLSTPQARIPKQLPMNLPEHPTVNLPYCRQLPENSP